MGHSQMAAAHGVVPHPDHADYADGRLWRYVRPVHVAPSKKFRCNPLMGFPELSAPKQCGCGSNRRKSPAAGRLAPSVALSLGYSAATRFGELRLSCRAVFGMRNGQAFL